MGKVAIAAGGTAGHVKPGLALAYELINQGLDSQEIVFFGTLNGQDKEILKGTSFKAYYFDTKGIVGKKALELLRNVIKLVQATLKTFFIVKNDDYKAVVAFGGYACIPASFVALVLRKPLFVVVLDALAGRVTKILSKVATLTITTQLSGTKRGQWQVGYFIDPKYLELKELKNNDELVKKTKENLGLDPNLKTLLIMGGSLGARAINEMVPFIVESFKESLNIIHISGLKNNAEFAAINGNNYLQFQFLNDLRDVYLVADLAITRAGAMSLAELSAVGIPAIVIPFPAAADNHQFYNALRAQQSAHFKIIEQSQATPQRLVTEIKEIFFNHNRSLVKEGHFELSPDYLGAKKVAELISGLVKEDV